MGKFLNCSKCGKYDGINHQCPPEWEAIHADYGDEDEPEKVYSYHGAGCVAEEFASLRFSSWDYPDEMEIWVRQPGLTWIKFNVSVQPVPEFTAIEHS